MMRFQASPSALRAFAAAMLRASLRDWRTTAAVLLTPLSMLLAFRFLSGDGEGTDLFVAFFPGIVAMGLFFVGAPLATRLVTWRERGIFRRLACTPQPLGWLLLALAAVSAGLGVVQTLLILGLGRLLGAPLTAAGLLRGLPFILLGAACFTAYGLMLSGFARKAETVNVLYVFSLLPMVFASPLFLPSEALPPLAETVGRWLPPSLTASLLQTALLEAPLPDQAPAAVLGLLTWGLFFSMVSLWRFHGP